MTDKERYAELRKNGICVYCKSRLATDGKCTCDECRVKMRKQTAEKRNALMELGFCHECGRRKIYYGEKLCFVCSERKLANNRKRRSENRESIRQQQSAYHKKRRSALKENGICVKCGKRPAELGKTRCALCNIKERDRARRSRGTTISRSERPNYRLCYFCGKEISAGRICQECSARVQGNLPENPPKNLEWERQNRLIKRS